MTDDLTFEASYWGNCCNTFDEDQKQYVYAKFMGLNNERWSFNVKGISILDIGGGPSSMLLKCFNLKRGKVIDPIAYPPWTKLRYQCMNIDVEVKFGEDVVESGWDEVWIYNCLQHCKDPKKIIHNALNAANILRIFEWINIEQYKGHPTQLTKEYLDECIGIQGSGTVYLNESGCVGRAYYGVFKKEVKT